MYNLYGSTKEAAIRKQWHITNELAEPWPGGIIGPRKPGAIVRRARNAEGHLIGPGRDLVVGR